MLTTQTYSPSMASAKQGLMPSILKLVGASLIIGLFAQISIPLFFSPVPITGQTLGILLVGSVLGSRMGAWTVLLYLFEGGVLGLPVFAGGYSGISSLIGPTCGYFAGFVLQAYLAGWIIERMQSYQPTKIAFALVVCCLLQLSVGAVCLAGFVGWENVMMMGFLPFVPGEIVKSLLVTTYLKTRFTQRD